MLSTLEITAPDGTKIGCHVAGKGRPLVLVHGTSGEHGSFNLMQPYLAEKFTLIAVDRRGRGSSGDSRDRYSITREFEDVAAVVDAFDEPVNVFGHSYGALVVFGAVPLSRNLARLVLYEAPCGVMNVSNTFLEQLDDLARSGDFEALLIQFLVDFVGVEPELLNADRAQPDWGTRVAAAATIPRELRWAQQWKPNAIDYREVRTPTILLLGSDSPDWAKQATQTVNALIKDSQVVILQGQGHIATGTAPELVAAKIADFLLQ